MKLDREYKPSRVLSTIVNVIGFFSIVGGLVVAIPEPWVGGALIGGGLSLCVFAEILDCLNAILKRMPPQA